MPQRPPWRPPHPQPRPQPRRERRVRYDMGEPPLHPDTGQLPDPRDGQEGSGGRARLDGGPSRRRGVRWSRRNAGRADPLTGQSGPACRVVPSPSSGIIKASVTTGAPVIIFDSSALFGLSPDDPKCDLLRALKQSGQQSVGIPWMVQEELVAQRVLRHAEAHRAAVSATRDLNRVAPWLAEQGPKPFDRDEAADHWRKAYGRLFEIVETSGDGARRALLREANCEKPARGADAKGKGGARDAAIWLSVVEYLKGNPGEKVYFVSSNTHDFGDGTDYPAPMSEDVEGLEDRLALLTSFDAVVSEFRGPVETA